MAKKKIETSIDEFEELPPLASPQKESGATSATLALANRLKGSLKNVEIYSGSESELGEPQGYVSTGYPDLDAILSRDGKGYPYGRIIEIFGDNGTGKSGLASNLIARVQQQGGLGVICVCEGEYSEWLAKKYGVDTDNVLVLDSNIVEDVLTAIQEIVTTSEVPTVIVVDSVAGLVTRAAYESEVFDQSRSAMLRAQLLSQGLARIGAKLPRTQHILFLINQVNEGAITPQGFQAKPKPVGGKRIGFYASIRLRLESVGKYSRTQNKVKKVAGFKVKVTTEKNRLADPYQSCELKIDFDHGLMGKTEKKGDETDE